MVISFINEKGGVGKTSLCFNIGYYIASMGKKVLFIDFDGQRANLSFFCGIKNREERLSMADVLNNGVDIHEAITHVETCQNLDIVIGNSNLAEVDKNTKLPAMIDAMKAVEAEYDYILIDVNPTPSRIHILAMAAANYIIIPMLADVATLEANKGVIETFQLVKANINRGLKIMGIVFNKFNTRANLSQQVLDITEEIATAMDTSVFQTKVRNNKALAENIAAHVGVTEHDPKSNGAQDIITLTSEILIRAYPVEHVK